MFIAFATFYTGPEEGPADDTEVQSLVRAARVGNVRAARRLYSLHVARVFRAVRGVCSSESEAEDVTQDAFIRALGSLVKYEPRDGVPFIAWVLSIAMNLARKSKARSDRHSNEDAPVESSSTLSDGDVLLKKKLLAALGKLPERERQILSLRYGAELSADEVAEVTGVSAANVRKICERQRGRLQKKLEEEP
ncbi:MAG: RNA polymerase sigma factor [Archangium sp.]